MSSMIKSAIISECGTYRYSLSRTWDDFKGHVNWIMLNPSTADADRDDPAVRKCIKFAQTWGYGGIVVTNLFGYRATDPKQLKKAVDIVGRENLRHVYQEAARANLVVCAWGFHGKLYGQGEKVAKLLRDQGVYPHVLNLLRDGEPAHPLYVTGTVRHKCWQVDGTLKKVPKPYEYRYSEYAQNLERQEWRSLELRAGCNMEQSIEQQAYQHAYNGDLNSPTYIQVKDAATGEIVRSGEIKTEHSLSFKWGVNL